jgi:hypothetical protein
MLLYHGVKIITEVDILNVESNHLDRLRIFTQNKS